MAPDVMRLIGLLHTLCVHSTASASNCTLFAICLLLLVATDCWTGTLQSASNVVLDSLVQDGLPVLHILVGSLGTVHESDRVRSPVLVDIAAYAAIE